MKNVSIQYLKSIPINKKIKSVHDGMYDNVMVSNTPTYWDRIMDASYERICWFLSKVSTFHDLDDIKTIFDVGSLNGSESVMIAQLLPHCRIYSFEPHPVSVNMVRDNQKDFSDRLTCIQKAVSDFNGKTKFHVTPTSGKGASSLLKPIGGPAGTSYTEIEVECTTVEQFCKENNIKTVDMFWMDVQGNELNVIKGIGSMINDVKVIYAETGKRAYYENHTMETEITEYLSSRQFVKQDKFDSGNDWEEDNLYIREKL